MSIRARNASHVFQLIDGKFQIIYDDPDNDPNWWSYDELPFVRDLKVGDGADVLVTSLIAQDPEDSHGRFLREALPPQPLTPEFVQNAIKGLVKWYGSTDSSL